MPTFGVVNLPDAAGHAHCARCWPFGKVTLLFSIPVTYYAHMPGLNPSRLVTDLPSAIGRQSINSVLAIGELTVLFGQVCRAWYATRSGAERSRSSFTRLAFLSLPVVLISGLSIGLVLAVQAYATLATVSGESATGSMVNYAMTTQLAPVVAGLMLAGRVGSAIAAEIGSMKVTEQLDALEVMGTDPVAYLVAPRFLACVLLLPILTALASLVGIIGASWLATSVWDLDPGAYWAHARNVVQAWDVVMGLAKTVVFGAIISLIACRSGLRSSGGATGVGNACTEGVVTANMLILVSNFVLTVLIQKLHGVIFG